VNPPFLCIHDSQTKRDMNAKTTMILMLLSLILPMGMPGAQAQDRLFTYTYQSTVLNRGQMELESWHTIRTGREDFYVRYDNRTEFEVGLGSNLQTAFYLNITSKTTTVTEDSVKSLRTGNGIGFSNEWKLKLLDPVAHPVGLALYAEIGIGSDELEIEGKMILDKRVGHFTVAFNGVYEAEFAPDYKNNELEWGTEQKLDGYLAFAWSFGNRFHLTQENAFKNILEKGKITHSALYSGVGFSYSQDKFWANFTVLPQVAAFRGATQNGLNLDEYEKIQFRLLFSFMF
jgi:hypothetical protein